MASSVVYQSPSLWDKCLTMTVGNVSKYPLPEDSYFGSLCDRITSAVGRCLSMIEGAALLDKTLKLVDAGLKLTKHISPEAYQPAAPMHKGITEVRGWIGGIKIPGGLWRVVAAARNLWDLSTKTATTGESLSMNARGWMAGDPSKAKHHQTITTVALQRLAIIHQSLSLVADSLYTAAFISKTFKFIDTKYSVMKDKMLSFSKSFPNIFFALHIVTVPKVLIGMKIEHDTFARDTRVSVVLDSSISLEKARGLCQKRRDLEIAHWRNQTGAVIELVKTGFEFVGDGANLSKTASPVVALVSTVGVAVFDFAGSWLKTM